MLRAALLSSCFLLRAAAYSSLRSPVHAQSAVRSLSMRETFRKCALRRSLIVLGILPVTIAYQ